MTPRTVHLASVYRPWFHAEEYDLVIAQIAGAHAVWIAKGQYEKGETSIRDFDRMYVVAGEAVTDAARTRLDVLLERLAKLREGA